jgi:hypothetical protein
MVEVRISRLVAETLADEGEVAAASRMDTSVLAAGDASAEVRTSRLVVEVLGQEPDVGAVSRMDTSLLAIADQPAEVRITRLVVEVLAGPDSAGAVSRMDTSLLASANAPAEVRVSRISGEALARQGSAGSPVPLALADDSYIFLHNWATKAVLRTSFRTDVVRSPDSGAEARRGLNVKPHRSMDLEWQISDGETVTGINSLIELERLEVLLRRMTDARFQMPIYKDQQELNADYDSLDSLIVVPTRRARFFQGQRVAIVQLDHCSQPISHTFHIIQTMTNDSLTFDAPLGVDIAAGSLVFPIMDCEVTLEAEATYSTARVPSVKMTVSEAPGASQLPPLKSDNPAGAELAEHDERPIWFEEPDWKRPVVKGRSRAGSVDNKGRAELVSAEGERSRQTHSFGITGTREDMWNALEFFETRRGRLRSFWHIDQDQYMVPIDIDTVSGLFVSVSENDLDLADTQEEFDAVGIVMADGSHYVTDVASVQNILTVFRIATINAFPLGLMLTDVVRVARARLVRFAKDEFTETWTHTGYMTARIDIIEVLNETDFPLI